MFKVFFRCFFSLVLLSSTVFGQTTKSVWADSILSRLSIEEKIGQMMMVPVSGQTSQAEIDELIKEFHIGGVVFLHGGPVRQVRLTNHFQKTTTIPLLIGQEAEWGLGMMLDSTISFPRALVLGAIKDDSLIYSTGKEIAREMKALGVNINFAPVADMNNNPENEISYRSFGADKFNVANKTVSFMRGMQDYGIMACAKDFPVNGLTVIGAQKGLPVITPFVDSVKAYPFKKLFENGLTGVVPASADFPLFYEKKVQIKKNKFSSNALTSIFTGEWIKSQMHFNGLVFVDIPGMQSATKKYRSGEAEMFAFQAGNDVLLSPSNMAQAVRKIKKLIKKDISYEAVLNASVKKILETKYVAGLSKVQPVNADNLVSRLNNKEALLLKHKLYQSAATVIRNTKGSIPVKALDNRKFVYLSTADDANDETLPRFLSRYVAFSTIHVNEKTNADVLRTLLADKQVIVAGFFPQTSEAVLNNLLPVLKTTGSPNEVIICDFGNGSVVKQADDFSTFITGYVNTREMLEIIPQIIFGGFGAQGILPYTATPSVVVGTGIVTSSLNRFSYAVPEEAEMDAATLTKIDAIANEAIAMKATPGCQVFVARNGKIVYEKSYGYLTYENKTPVTEQTIYDLASVTKVSATLQAVMFLQERGMIDIYRKISYYLPELKNSNKKDFTIKDILTHQAGLWPFLPFWAQTMKDSTYLPAFYSSIKSDQYPLQVADKLFASAAMKDSLWNWIVKAKIREKPSRTPFDYKYSDMGFYIMQHLVEKLLNQPLEDFIHQNLYDPLGSSTTGYLPLLRFPPQQIAPTENDKLFRKSLLVGTVHDQGAAMYGGAAGHAGLFSNASDLAKLGQMLLQGGTYGGNRFYKPETVHFFTQKQFETSRRGLGWDRPAPGDPNSPTSAFASPKTFGHTGFTGTCIWVDPEFNLVYVFLSNRVHPSMTNNKLINANIRPRIQDVIYESIFNYCQY
jgi:beta-N-acetylhexosaminidase